jgi:CelD/BcsL family acetyltransferase involved in cellulose biosynthesis
MSAAENRKVVLVTRQTRLEELVARYQTLGQAQFYLEHLGADFTDYLRENEAYASSLRWSRKHCRPGGATRSSTGRT